MSTITWRGGASGDWSAGYNWSGLAVPRAGDTVVIGDGAVVTIDTPGVAALDITLGATSTLDLAGTLDLGGTLYGGELLLAGTLVGGTLDAPLDVGLVGSVLDGVDVLGDQPLGDIAITPATALATGPSPIISSGDLTLDPGTYGGAFQFDPLDNATLAFATVGDITLAPTATVSVGNAGTDNPILFSGGGTVTNQGSISLGGDTTPLTYAYGNAVDIAGDGFVNAGTLTLVPNAGTFEPVPTGLDVSETVFANSRLLSDPAGTISIDAVPQGGLAVGGDTFDNGGTITAAQVVAGGDVGDFINTGSIAAGGIVFDNFVKLARLGRLTGVVTIGGTLDLQGGSLDAGAFGAGLTVTGTVENGTLSATGGLLTLIGATLDDVLVQPGGSLAVAGPITLIDPPAGVGLTLDGTTTDIQVASAATLVTLAVTGAPVSASGTLTLSGGGQVTLTGTDVSIIGADTGSLSNGDENTDSVIDGASIDLQAGTLDIAAALTGDYHITLGAGAALVAAPASLLTPGGTLGGSGTITLGAGASITADTFGAGVTLDGLQSGDLIDLTGLSPIGTVTPAAQIVDGALEITAASGQTARIALADAPADATLLVLNDGQGGSLIADPPLPPLTAETNFNGTPGTEYGSYALTGGTLTQGNVIVEGGYAVHLLDGAQWRTNLIQIGPPNQPANQTRGGGALLIDGGGTGGTLDAAGIAQGWFAGTVDTGSGAVSVVDDATVVTGTLWLWFSSLSVDATSSVVVGTGTATDGAVTVANGATLNVVAGSIAGNLIDSGTIDIGGYESFGLISTALSVSGDVTVTTAMTVGDYGNLDVGGSLHVLDGATLTGSDGPYTNLQVTNDIVLGATGTPSSATLVMNGADGGAGGVSLFDGSVISLVNQGDLALGDATPTFGALSIGDNATLSVDDGTIDGNVIDNGTIDMLSPDGINAGTLAIVGDLTINQAASTEIGAALNVTGAVSVATGAMISVYALNAGTLSGDATVRLDGSSSIGAIVGTPTIEPGRNLQLDGTNLSGLTVGPIGSDGPIASTIDLPDVIYSSSFGDNVQNLTIAGAAFHAANFGEPSAEPELFTSSDGARGTLIVAEIPCFAAGTRILTEHGEIPVEALLPGQRVRTASGRLAPITWIGRTTVNLSRHPDPARAAPIRIAADAFAPGVPCRDLYLSRDHALWLDGALIPVWRLANGASIARDDSWRSVTYYHVELDRHDIVLADGLASESYLDTGNRGLFANASGVRPLHPTFPDPDADALRIWAERAAAPLLLDGPVVAAHRARLLARAKTLGWERSDDAALSCFANGVALPIYRDETGWRARIPRHVTSLRLRSRSFIQAERGRDSGDLRRLGLAVAELLLDGQTLPPDCLGAGWHAPDTTDTPWRWTDGNAHVALPPRAGAARLDIRLAYHERYLARRAVAARATA